MSLITSSLAVRPGARKVAGHIDDAWRGDIVVSWLIRLRWIAGLGQASAVAVAMLLLHMPLNLPPIAALIGVNLISNTVLWFARKRGRLPGWATPTILLLDVLLLSGLLYFAGGPGNPFAILYLVHVTMAVVMLGSGWAWAVVVTSAGCYAVLKIVHQPLFRAEDAAVLYAGEFFSLVLVAVLVAYFTGRVMRALRERQNELSRLRAASERSHRLAALSTLAAGAAHELNTPLSTIALVAKEMELHASRTDVDTQLLEDAQLVRREVERCRDIIQRMRGDLEEEEYPSAEQSIEQTVHEVVRNLPENRRERIDVHAGVNPSGEPTAPAASLRQALRLLIDNAFKAAETGRVRVLVSSDAQHTIVAVEDDGVGLSDEAQRRAGEPFFTTRSPGDGMGLGLFLVGCIADRLGGDFSIGNRPQGGVRAELSLPASNEHGNDSNASGG